MKLFGKKTSDEKLMAQDPAFLALPEEQQNYLLAQECVEQERYAEAAIYFERAGYSDKAQACREMSAFS